MRFAVHTLGCKVNSCESASIADSFISAGYEQAEPPEPADVYIINSCAVTGIAVKKTRQLVSRCKSENPDAIVILCGCFPQAYPDDADGAEGADIVTGNSNKAELPGLVGEFLSLAEEKGRIQLNAVNKLSREFDEKGAGSDLDRTRAFIKIEDGCDRFCTYCIIPTARGRVRSRLPQDIARQAALAAGSGHKEVVLTGINLGCYGQDIDLFLSDAVKAADVDGIERIRLGSLEPEMITPEETEKFARIPKLCPHFHLSLQSGSDAVLKRMRRRYTAEEFSGTVERLRRAFPNCSITTDIMVGFTGETDEEFAESLAFAESIGFAKLHVFPYSIRPGTVAAMRQEQIVPHIKSERSRQMEALSRKLAERFLQSQTGSVQSVLIEKQTDPRYCGGFTPNYTPVRIYGEEIPRHSIVNVKITAARGDHAEGVII